MKKIVSIVLCSLLLFSLVGCGKSNDIKEDTSNIENTEETADVVSNSLDQFKADLKEKSLTVGSNEEFVYEDLSASLAYKFDVNGSSIEIYYYDKDNLFDGADKVIEEAKTGTITRDEKKVNVLYSNYYMLIGADTNSESATIEEVFNNLFK
ncbi:MAG: hypothetical protein GX275_00565 [Clostridiales bacterium]|nr:hypothetical protein [Clostridiales bacterium]